MNWAVYAENKETGKKRFVANCVSDNIGRGVFDLYADQASDEEEIVIEPAERTVADAGRKGGKSTSPKKADAARANKLESLAAGKNKGGRPTRIESVRKTKTREEYDTKVDEIFGELRNTKLTARVRFKALTDLQELGEISRRFDSVEKWTETQV